ncbi:MAG: response regulator [Pseudobdellovibrio sp.]
MFFEDLVLDATSRMYMRLGNKVAVVDDDIGMVHFLKDVLTEEGYEVSQFFSAKDALLKFKSHPPQIVITDHKMKDIDGLMFLKKIQTDYPETVSIMMSAYGTIETAVEAMKSGAYHFISKPFKNEELIHITNTASDKIKSLSKENSIQDNNQFFKLAVEASGDSAWDLNIPNNSINYSKNGLKMHGFAEDKASLSLDEWSKSIHPDDLGGVMEAFKNHFDDKGPYTSEHRVLRSDGSYMWIFERGMVVSRLPDGSPVRMVGTQTNINKIKQAELNLIQTSKIKLLSEMSVGFSHEINNPLTIITGAAELLLRQLKDSEKAVSKIAAIQKASENISKCIANLNKISRISSGEDYKPHALSELIHEAITLTKTKSILNCVEIICEIKSESYILCDAIEIEQVLINLINNGINAAKTSSDKWVKIEAFDFNKLAIIRITDSGQAIPEKIKNKLFDPFFTSKKAGANASLGLPNSKAVLYKHSSTIAFAPNLTNTCIEICFPKIKNFDSNIREL